jgi:hypothetical protein
MPTTQKSPQKHTKATQKVGGSAKKPVTKAMEGGKGKVASVKSKTATRGGGSARGGSFYNYEDTKKRSMKNEELINFLYKIIISLVEKLNEDLIKSKKFGFRVEKYQDQMNENQTADIYDTKKFESLIDAIIDDREDIYSIEKIFIENTL